MVVGAEWRKRRKGVWGGGGERKHGCGEWEINGGSV